MKNKNITEQLLNSGFNKERRLWSFSPKLQNNHYYSKFITGGVDDSYEHIEIGIVVDEDNFLMEVYFCDCVVGCCGISYGIHNFDLKKINKLLEKYKEDYGNI